MSQSRDNDQWGVWAAIVIIIIGLVIAVFSGEYSLLPDTAPTAPPTPPIVKELTP